MRTFELHRFKDESGVSGTGQVAEGIEFGDGTCALRWKTEYKSTALYENAETLEKIHGHNGKTELVWTSETFTRAGQDALQDACENAPFGSVGGTSKRNDMLCPSYVPPEHHAEYLRGYRHAARLMYGADWETCEFGWAPAIMINGEKP